MPPEKLPIRNAKAARVIVRIVWLSDSVSTSTQTVTLVKISASVSFCHRVFGVCVLFALSCMRCAM